MAMTLEEIDDRLVPAANLIETAPHEALERLDDIVRHEHFAPEDMWRVWQCYSLIWYRLFDKQKSRAYAWQALTHPGGAPRITCPKQAAKSGSAINCGHSWETSGFTNGTPFWWVLYSTNCRTRFCGCGSREKNAYNL